MRWQQIAHTISADGTEIGYFTSGQGPPLVLVHGAVADRTRWDALRPHLEPHFTVHAMDRRGRGASGDHADYAVEREYEDVAAVVDAVAESSRCPVVLYGRSFGGVYAFGAASLTSNVSHLVLFEGWPTDNQLPFLAPPALVERMEAQLADDQPEAVVETVAREMAKMSAQEIAASRSHPSWSARVAAAHTIPRENRTLRHVAFDRDHIRRFSVPTLLLVGGHSKDWRQQVDTFLEALPDARVAVLDGQGHAADAVAPELVVEHLLAFVERSR
jgi:pimeloyl-ACP methyl ester carboxylesterase